MISQECSLDVHLSKSLKLFHCWIRWPQEHKTLDRFGNNFIGIFHGWPSNKIALNHFAPLNMMATRGKHRQTLKWFLINSSTDFEIITQICSLGHCLPKLLKHFTLPYTTYHFNCTIWIKWGIQGCHNPLVLFLQKMIMKTLEMSSTAIMIWNVSFDFL